MSRTSDTYAGQPFLIKPSTSTRTTDEIQRHIISRDKRNPISRRYHARDDKEAITAWKLEFNRVFHVFNVRFVTLARRSLTSRFQTELGINTHPTTSDTHRDATNKHSIISDVHDSPNTEVTVPDIHRDRVSNTSPIVSNIQSGIANTRTIVSNVHLNRLKGRGGVDGQSQVVSTTRPLPVTE